MNSIYSMLNNPFGNVQSMIERFNQFKRTFNGDPQQTINEMLKSGQINQTQIEQAKQMAEQFRSLMR